jgi:epoxyqueuosine reductase
MIAGDTREQLRHELHALGFDVVKFARVDGPLGDELAVRLAAGHLADMHWLERTAAKRLDPSLVLSGVRTVIMLGVNYGPGEPPTQARPIWARYALHDDYHDTIRPALAAAGRLLEQKLGLTNEDHRYYVDTGPVLERAWAERAGLGFFGKNAMLISRDFGNWLFLAAILTRAEIASDAPLAPERAGAKGGAARLGLLCGKCTRCLTACPTGAFIAPGVLDARRCVSYQTIENKGVIPRALRPGVGARVYGCDVCAEVCPWNRFAQASRGVLLAPRREIAALSLREILELTPARFAEVFRKTAIKRVKLAGLLRNACVVAGNLGAAGDSEARACLDILARLAATHPSPLVRGHAVWAVYRIAGHSSARDWLAAARAMENDATVLAEYAAEDQTSP